MTWRVKFTQLSSSSRFHTYYHMKTPGFALLFKLLVFSFQIFSCTFKSNVFDDTDGIFAFFQMSIKTSKQTSKT